MKELINRGYFGKGNLSRSDPVFEEGPAVLTTLFRSSPDMLVKSATLCRVPDDVSGGKLTPVIQMPRFLRALGAVIIRGILLGE